MKRLACIGLVAITVLVTAGDHSANVSPAASIIPQNSTSGAGMVVQFDPATGQIVEPTADGLRELHDRMNLNTSSEGLVEVPSDVPGGGYMVDLQGRFQHSMTATIDASGVVRTTCSTSGHSHEGVSTSCAGH